MSQQSSSCADTTEAYRQITESIAKDAQHGRRFALPGERLRFGDLLPPSSLRIGPRSNTPFPFRCYSNKPRVKGSPGKAAMLRPSIS